ncbi:hypothetical protein JAAARDRAFT_195775 [Jaapia argillacea MUCL 33604]|uniref:MYND-type domain-containing protein n=1 Tax=Jaapia argillacea MUCL 33604 TaxID=933084 RepID=A0A067PVS9_9AGAM|nr:hypothetical protein JAAARDRAFT_195775 [Jaapia argillacea MUCL 33604]
MSASADLLSRALRENPNRTIEAAKRGSLPDLTTLSSSWQDLPVTPTLTLTILSVFTTHLATSKVPPPPPPSSHAPSSTFKSVQLAFYSLLGLSHITPAHLAQAHPSIIPPLLKAWPGIFAWTTHFLSFWILPESIPNDKAKRDSIDVVTSALCAIARHPRIRPVMMGTPGLLEQATKLWILEDLQGLPPSSEIVPLGSALLDALLTLSPPLILDTIIRAGGAGKANVVAKIAITRLQIAAKAGVVKGIRIAMFADVLNEFSYNADHPLRHALLTSGVVTTVTKALVTVSSAIISNPNDRTLLDATVSLFGYLRNTLESGDGCTWITQSLNAGLLRAFFATVSSSALEMLEKEDREMIFSVLGDVLSRYLVYYSVIRAVENGLGKVDGLERGKGLGGEKGRVWETFLGLAKETIAIAMVWDGNKEKGRTCDNVKCNKVDVKNNFRKCSACQVTLYCSEECQVLAWKEGDHRTVCKLKQREQTDGKLTKIESTDKKFLHHLSLTHAQHSLAHLLSLASTQFASLPLTSLAICIDYTSLPPKFSLKALSAYNEKNEERETTGSETMEERNARMIERVRENGEKHTLVESVLCGGRGRVMLLTVTSGNVLVLGKSGPLGRVPSGGEWDEEEEEYGRDLSEGEVRGAREVLNRLMVRLGDPARF